MDAVHPLDSHSIAFILHRTRSWDIKLTKNNGVKLIVGLLNVKKILAVINATYAVAKRKPEKIRLAGIRTLTSAIPVQRSNQLS